MKKHKKILLLATGGTIASRHTENGMTPELKPEELLTYVPEAKEFCEVDTLQLFSMDSTNMGPEQWLELAGVITGAQKPIDLPITDARAHGVNIVFGGKVIAGTRAKKEYSKSYNAFSSIITKSIPTCFC